MFARLVALNPRGNFRLLIRGLEACKLDIHKKNCNCFELVYVVGFSSKSDWYKNDYDS